MERKVGEVFEHEGEMYKVYKEVHACEGCCFNNLNSCLDLKLIRGCCSDNQRKDCRGVIFKQIKKNMETRNVKLSLEKAKEFYAKGGEFKDLALSAFTEEELTKKELPKTWEEYMNNWVKRRKGVRLSDMSEVELDNFEVDGSLIHAHNVLVQLHLLRDCYCQGWKPKKGEINYAIRHYIGEEESCIMDFKNISHFLSFPTFKLAKEFLDNFKDLIEQAGDLI